MSRKKPPLSIRSLIGALPDFLIVGAQKGGTTSLYRYLAHHPWVRPAFRKEVHFFDRDYKKGLAWYKRHFSLTSLGKSYVNLIKRHPLFTGEATPSYLFHPHAPQRAFDIVPHAKIIMMLRNPVDRAFSHYQHHIKLKVESLSFEDAIAAEASRLEGEFERMLADPDYYSARYYDYSYLARGVYIDQVQRWLSVFPREQVLIIKSEDFFENTAAVFKDTLDFLQLPAIESASLEAHNVSSASDQSYAARAQLSAYFSPYNQKLYDYLGRDFAWE